jgi:hypothetical protein
MSISAFEKQALNNRVTNLLEFVPAHTKVIETVLIPIARESISKAETSKSAIHNLDHHPSVDEMEATGLAQADAKEAEAVLARFGVQTKDLDKITDAITEAMTHEFFGKPAAAQFVDYQQTSLVRSCRDCLRELVEKLKSPVHKEPLEDAKAKWEVLRRYLEDDLSDEEAFIAYVREWSRNNPDV